MQVAQLKPAFLSATLLLASSGAAADPVRQNDVNWLQIMAFAAHQTDYIGTFLYQYGNHVETSRITHIADRDGEHARLESLDGPKREVVRHNSQVWCYHGNGRVTLEQRQPGREFPALLPEQLSLLNENYQIKPAEEVRMTGFHAHALLLQPRDNFRYTHKMWADSLSGLLLKSAVLDERGNIIEQYSFTQLTIGGDIDRKWIAAKPELNLPNEKESRLPQKSQHPHDPPHDGDIKLTHSLPKTTTTPVESGWRIDALPAGFRKIAEVSRQLRGKDAPVIQMVFSDGLASISIFIEKSDSDDDDHTGLTSQGAIQVFSKVDNGHLITVVGEVPPRTVMQIAESVRNGASQQP